VFFLVSLSDRSDNSCCHFQQKIGMKSPHSETLVRKTSSQRSIEIHPKKSTLPLPLPPDRTGDRQHPQRGERPSRQCRQCRQRKRKEEEQDARLSGCRTYVFVSVLLTPRMEAWHSGKSHECSHHSSIASVTSFFLSTSPLSPLSPHSTHPPKMVLGSFRTSSQH
jgi:hypothetical protein